MQDIRLSGAPRRKKGEEFFAAHFRIGQKRRMRERFLGMPTLAMIRDNQPPTHLDLITIISSNLHRGIVRGNFTKLGHSAGQGTALPVLRLSGRSSYHS
jgi:hypothetical protein